MWIRDVPDYPKPGILFRDLTPLLADPNAFKYVTRRISERYEDRGLHAVAVVDSRGFLFGGPIAQDLHLPLIPFRKQDKLPPETIGVDFELEYATARLEARANALEPGMKVIVVDDLLATGGTAGAAVTLIERLGASVESIAFVVELTGLEGRRKLLPHEIFSLVQY